MMDPGEKEDLIEVMNDWLASNDIHDNAEDALSFGPLYLRVAKLYYVFTGTDYLCGHAYLTNFEGRP